MGLALIGSGSSSGASVSLWKHRLVSGSHGLPGSALGGGRGGGVVSVLGRVGSGNVSREFVISKNWEFQWKK